jgi:hypothetical protein
VGSGNRVITVIELLSLANKMPGAGKDLYVQKQQELLEGEVSLVEIDLLREGQWVLSVPPHLIAPLHVTAYRVCVRRGWQLDLAEICRAPLRERLPMIRVPLRPTDADVTLDLQELIETCYRNGRYDDIDYKIGPEPALAPEDAAWARELMARPS